MNENAHKKVFHTQTHSVSNGRVDIYEPRTPDLFQMYDKIPVNQTATFRNPTEGLWDNTQLSKMFFSGKNIGIIQNGIRAGVYQKSNGQFTISNQDEDTLKIIMRSIFLQNAANQPTHISEQVTALNQLVWNYCIPQVYGEAQGYRQYIVDASTMYTPLPPPIMSTTSDKELMLKEWF
jgi:hypothetical protein